MNINVHVLCNRLNREMESNLETLAMLTIFGHDDQDDNDPYIMDMRSELEKQGINIKKLVR